MTAFPNSLSLHAIEPNTWAVNRFWTRPSDESIWAEIEKIDKRKTPAKRPVESDYVIFIQRRWSVET